MYEMSRIHLIGYLVEDGITSSVHAKHTFSRTSIMLRFRVFGVFLFIFHSTYIPIKQHTQRHHGGHNGKNVVVRLLLCTVVVYYVLARRVVALNEVRTSA